jgi:hypothetical protein
MNMLSNVFAGGVFMSVQAKARRIAASFLGAAALVVTCASVASAQEVIRGPASDLITFDRWCLEIANYDESRCEARRPDDYQEFRVYRDRIEQFEPGFLVQKEQDRVLLDRVETQDDIVPVHNLD